VTESEDRAYAELTRAIIGAAIDVHRALGPGFLETVYEEALCIELGLRGLSYAQQTPIAVSYKGKTVGESQLDILVEDRVILELKAVDYLAPIHSAQLLSYLKATGLKVGLLINI
jgi:GxxExxY protein